MCLEIDIYMHLLYYYATLQQHYNVTTTTLHFTSIYIATLASLQIMSSFQGHLPLYKSLSLTVYITVSLLVSQSFLYTNIC